MSPATDTPIVLVHGFWVTPRSFEVEVEALNEDPTLEHAVTPATQA